MPARDPIGVPCRSIEPPIRIPFIWGSDYAFTNCNLEEKKTLELSERNLARGEKFKGCSEIPGLH